MAPARQDDSELIRKLEILSKKNPKLVRHSDYVAPAAPEMTIRSWKMNEFKYYAVPSPFPTLARGLFTTQVKVEGKKPTKNDAEHRIVIRGYDKFFNIGEVPWTTWVSLEENTAPPYTLSLKANGCIIFIAALTPTKLLVTSKHSLGPVKNNVHSHSEVGERWLKTHLQNAGKTTDGLAAILWENKWTAVAELCDDDFEEHVLPYPPEKTGLHLHGINETIGEFKTQPTEVVDKFAEEWGFLVNKSIVLNSMAEVKAFAEETGKTGSWNGEAVEGFVVRTEVVAPRTNDARSSQASLPYAPGSSFFFKIKFDEPYMMYRDWRELTKMLLAAKGSLDSAKLPNSKMKRPETKLYVKWVKGEIKRDKSQFATYSTGKGIIRTRERFLEWMKSEQGQQAQLNDQDTTSEPDNSFGKTIIVPVAIPGVGKTSLSVALAHLFGFGHTQSDDINVKKSAPIFVKKVVSLLKNHDVVIADKNNHLRQHRQALRQAIAKMTPPVRLLALNWAFNQSSSTIHRICSDRVLNRGENHQSLRADSNAKSHEDIIWRFINDLEELTENEVDNSIGMEIGEPLEQALIRAIDGCVDVLGLPRPSEEKIGEALVIARGYQPKKKKPHQKSVSQPRYYGLLAEVDLEQNLAPVFSADGIPEDGRKFWNTLVVNGRITKRPHVTIVHSKSLPQEQQLWDLCQNLHLIPNSPLFKFRLGNVVWNDRVMAITVETLAVIPEEEGVNMEGAEFVANLPQNLTKVLHITVGTDDGISAYEARGLVESWKNGAIDGKVGSVALSEVYCKGRLRGLVS